MKALLCAVIIAGGFIFPGPAAAEPLITSFAATPASADEATLFAFDNYSIPFQRNLYLTMHPAKEYAGNPIIAGGRRGAPDEYATQLYGSVFRIGGQFRMWYLGQDYPEGVAGLKMDPQDFDGFHICYAESEDGIHWTKPDLGLVEFKGSRRNNAVLSLPPQPGASYRTPGPGAVFVLYEPEERDPQRRYKMMLLVQSTAHFFMNTILPFFSADGLHWRQAVPGRIDPKGFLEEGDMLLRPHEAFEMGGLYHFQGAYYVTGQQFFPHTWLPDGTVCGRVMTIFRSPDFLRWSDTQAQGFIRWGYHSAPVNQGEEVHMPAACWNRGNVLVGLYGQFHGSSHSDLHPLDLGLLLSNDGVHFREGVDDFIFVCHNPNASWEAGGVVQGQTFINVGDETYVYYCGWDRDVTDENTRTEIGLARLRRDGFGSLSPKRTGEPAALVTCALKARGPVQIWLNATGLTPRSRLKVELLDEEERPLPGFSGSEAASLEASGTRIPVRWPRRARIDASAGAFRLRVSFEGGESGRPGLYALYLGRPGPG